MNYKKMDELKKLHQSGALTDEEFEYEKQKVLAEEEAIHILGIEERGYLGVLNFLLLIPACGWILAIIAWAIGKEKSKQVDIQGRNIACWILSSTIYSFILMVLLTNSFNFNSNFFICSPSSNVFGSLFFTSLKMAPITILTILTYVFPIMGGLKGLKGECWYYPLSIRFFKKI